jgi:photosystem II stability/assembly factor-like uncharacterized protein
LVNLIMSALPWAIIAGLLYAGLFIKPTSAGASVTPPALERRDRLYGIAALQDGLVAVAANGKILSIGAGGKVVRRNSPVSFSLQDVASFDAKRALTVGNDNTILYTEDGGSNWVKAANVPRSSVANKLNRVRAGANGFAIAVGEMGALLASNDYGKTWQRLREEEDLAWNDVAILDGGVLVVVGEFGNVLRSENGGKRWEKQPAPVPGSLMSVAFRDASNGVAVGLDGVVLTTADGGRKWSSAMLSIREHLLDVLWNPTRNQWFAVGVLGRWVSGNQAADGLHWQAGMLGEHTLSWHTRALASGSTYWLAGADVGTWDGKQWLPLKP